MALSPSQSRADLFISQKKSASAPPSRAGSRNRNCSRSRSRDSRKGKSRVDFFAYVNSNPDIQEAIEVIKSHPAGDELMEVLVAYFQQPGKKSDIINLANKLLIQPSAPHARPIDRTQHIRPQEPYYEMDSSNDVESMRKALLNLELQDRTLQRRLIEPPKEFAIGHSSIGDHDRVRMEMSNSIFLQLLVAVSFLERRTRNPE